MEVPIKFVKTLDPQQILASQVMSHELWGDGVSLQDRTAKLLQSISYDDGKFLSMSGLINIKGELISSLKRYTVAIKYENQIFRTIGLGAVFTAEEFRGKGYAKAMIDFVLADAKRSDFSAALLFSDIKPSYYEQFGFIEFPAETLSVNVTDLTKKPSTLQLREANINDVSELIRLYESSFDLQQLRPTRDVFIWNFFRERNGPTMDYLLSKGGQVIGYMSLSHRESGVIFLNEYGISPSDEDALCGILREFSEKNGIKTIKCWQRFPRQDDVPNTMTLRTKAIPMLASLNRDLRLEEIAKETAYFGAIDHF